MGHTFKNAVFAFMLFSYVFEKLSKNYILHFENPFYYFKRGVI